MGQKLEIFLSTVPGLEHVLLKEAHMRGFSNPEKSLGGVSIVGSWRDVWRANLEMRGASKILVRLGSFKVAHLAKLDKAALKFPWHETFPKGSRIKVEVTCKKSKIYHSKAAAERFEKALKTTIAAEISDEADLCLKIRIIKDICTISVDTSGEGLHKRGSKQAVNKAPLRETLAAQILSACGFKAGDVVVDPMCGSGTFAIEAAEMTMGLQAGRNRDFAFEQLMSFDANAWQKLKTLAPVQDAVVHAFGFDRDEGAIAMATANAKRAGVDDVCAFKRQAISDLTPPLDGNGDRLPAGLVVVNPPYGGRIGSEKKLRPLYAALGKALLENFKGWRFGMVTNSDSLAHATGLDFDPKALAFSHGGINVKAYQAKIL